MSDARKETVSDIVREMRIGDLCAEDTSASRPEYINDFLAGYADRIEAAWKRESEAGAEAAQICSEIGEIIGRATTEKSSAVGNANAVQEVAQEMLNTSMQAVTAERINGWAMRLAEACEQPVTDCNQLGNAAAMREALEKCRALAETIWQSKGGEDVSAEIAELKDIISAALAAPARNCDIGTVKEQAERFDEFCYNHRSREKGCGDCPLLEGGPCELAWMQMPYEEGGAK